MANRTEIMSKVEEVKGTDKIGDLVNYMVNEGFTTEQWDMTNSKFDVLSLNALASFFGTTLEGEKPVPVVTKSKADIKAEAKHKAKSDAIKKAKADKKIAEAKAKAKITPKVVKAEPVIKKDIPELNEKSKGDQISMSNIPVAESPTTIKNKYKTIHNLIGTVEGKETVIENVVFGSDLGEDIIYQTCLTGGQLVEMFMDSTLVFDPSMQRGVKEDINGNHIANFTDAHVKDIAKAMELNMFSPSLIELAVITSDKDLKYNYDTNNSIFTVEGLLRLVDGQHRVRAMVLLHQLMKVSKVDKNFNLDKYVFPVQIHITSAEFARIIYNNINKMRKLDKSQSRQLSNDRYAKITNRLSMYSESPLKDKIATSKPVGNKLVLFSTIAEQLQKTIKSTTGKEIESNRQMEEIQDYLFKFFDYLVYKMPSAFGSDGKERLAFRSNNLLNENNFFEAWIELAMADKVNYEKNIDKIADNIEFFNKDAKILVDGVDSYKWEKLNSVKTKSSGVGFAIANTSTGKGNLTKQTFELVGLVK